jgi:hypothetical protein
MKPDEIKFLIQVAIYSDIQYIGIDNCVERKVPREIINEPDFYMHDKRAWYLLGKWCDKGWYEYGVTLDLGWMTQTGQDQVTELMNKEISNACVHSG